MKNLYLIVSVLIITTTASFSETQPIQPTDTDGNGYINISTLGHLRWLSESPEADLTAGYELDNDIDASETREWNIGDHDDDPMTPDSAMGWKPIGYFNPDTSKSRPFNGKLFGNGYSIIGLYINRPDEDNVGLFSYTQSKLDYSGLHNHLSVEVLYLELKDYEITGRNCVGAICGRTGNPDEYFHVVIDHCIVKNGTVSGVDYVGGLVGKSYSKISYSYSFGSVIGTGDISGGLIGYNGNDIYNCFARGQIRGNRFVGGVVGKLESTFMSVCYWAGEVYGNESVGGIAGENLNSDIQFCYWDTDSKSNIDHDFEHGMTRSEMKDTLNYNHWNFTRNWLIDEDINNGYPILRGFMAKPDKPEDTDADGMINLSTIRHLLWLYKGGFNGDSSYELDNNIDYNDRNDIYMIQSWQVSPLGNEDTPFSGTFDGNGFAIKSVEIVNDSENTGFFGVLNDAVVKDLTLDINIGSEGRNVGGITGQSIDSKIVDCEIDCSIQEGFYSGGVVGVARRSIIERCNVNGIVDGDFHSGGIAGIIFGAEINKCTADVKVEGYKTAGGLVGRVEVDSKINGPSYGSIIRECYSIGDVSGGAERAGGLCGELFLGSTIKDSYSRAEVRDSYQGGGFVGGDSGEIVNCYSVGQIEQIDPFSRPGGFSATATSFGGKAQTTSCYWDVETSDTEFSDSGLPRTTAEMKSQTNYVGWDFDNIWAIDPDINDGYPYLKGTGVFSSVQTEIAPARNWINIYPNPVGDFLNLDFAKGSIDLIKIYDLRGSLILTAGSASGINVSQLLPGIYMIAIESGDTSYTSRFVKQ